MFFEEKKFHLISLKEKKKEKIELYRKKKLVEKIVFSS